MFFCFSRKEMHAIMLGVLISACSVLMLSLTSLLSGDAAEEDATAEIATANTAVTASAALEWGLSFAQEDTPPIPNVSAEDLLPYDAYYCDPTASKKLYITFDAGYENGYTDEILDALQKHSAPAAFFVVGSYIEEQPELIARMVAEGHIIGNHTQHHSDMSQLSQAEFAAELQAVEAMYAQIIGQAMPKFYRPPQGKFSTENLQWAQELGYTTVFWSLAYVDWYVDDQPSAAEAFEKLLPRTYDGTIVLLHSTSATNAEILDELLTQWEEMGYTFASLAELGAAA